MKSNNHAVCGVVLLCFAFLGAGVHAAGCSSTQLANCRTNIYPTLSVCAAGVQPRFDNSSCCVNCRLRSSVCTDAAYAACKPNVRLCDSASFESPIVDPSACCPTCRRPESICNASQVGLCLARRSVCSVGQDPAPVAGECCLSCRLEGTLTCPTACERDRDCLDVAGTLTCVKAQFVRVMIQWQNASNVPPHCAGVRSYLNEIIARFCERGNNAVRCQAALPVLKSMAGRPNHCEVIPAKKALIADVHYVSVAGIDPTDAVNIFRAALADANSIGDDASGSIVPNRPVCSIAPLDIISCDHAPPGSLRIDSTTDCPTCRPRNALIDNALCTSTALEACARTFSSLPTCAAGVDPVRSSSTCCLSCRPGKQAVCPDDKIDLCRSRYPNLRDCGIQESPIFDPATCCVSCKVGEMVRTESSPRCNSTDVSNCLLNRPICASNEEPMFNRNTSCCAHCRRPERQCPFGEVARCSLNTPICAPNTAPITLPNECCPTCRIAEPVCDTPCSDRARCVVDFATGRPACLIPRTIRLIVRKSAAVTNNDFNISNPNSTICLKARAVFLDAIKHYCDNADYADRCNYVREQIRNFVARKCTWVADDSIAIDYESFEPAASSSLSNRTLQFEQIVQAAMQYSVKEEVDGFVTSALTQDRFRVTCPRTADQIPVCINGARPILDRSTGCLSCRPSNGKPCTCTLQPAAIRPCAQRESPQRDPDTCCPTCLPLRNATLSACTPTEVDACVNALKGSTLPPCVIGESAFFNRTSCCLTCSPLPVPPAERPAANGSCTRTQFQACIAKAPVCAEGELPVQVPDRCCASCRTLERSCAITDVGRCVANLRTCLPRERPAYLDDECCPTCVLRPTCNCSTTEVCDASGAQAVCRPIGATLRALFRRVNDTQALDCDAGLHAFKEAIRRVCDEPRANATRCDIASRLAGASNSLDCVRENDNTYINIDLPVTSNITLVATDIPTFVRQALSSAQTADGSSAFELVTDARTCTLDASTIRLCNADEVPVLQRATKCYSCRTASGRAGCTDAKIEICKTFVPPPCAAGETPTRNETSCCPTCRLVQAVCSTQRQDLCRANISQNLLPLCEVGATPQFDKETCCVNCRRDAAKQEGAVETGQKCTQAQFDSCLTNSPVCANGESPARVTGSCCPSCKRPERLCSPSDVVACRASVRTCQAGELPASTGTDCCPTCIPSRTACSPACNASQICTQEADGDARCRYPGSIVKLVLRKGTDAVPRCSLLVTLIQEFVNRFCDKNENAAACDAGGVRDDLAGLELKSCVRTGALNESAEISIIVPADAPSVTLQRRSSAGSAALVTSASQDPSSTSGLSVQSASTSGDEGSGSNNLPIIIGAVVGGCALIALVALVAVHRTRSHGRHSTSTTRVTPASPSSQNTFADTTMY